MLTLDNTNTDQFGLGDATLESIAWVNDGRDVCLCLRAAGGRAARLSFAWASGLRLDFTYDQNNGGQPLSWGASYERVGQEWHVTFEFPPQGEISLVCNDVVLEYLEGDVAAQQAG